LQSLFFVPKLNEHRATFFKDKTMRRCLRIAWGICLFSPCRYRLKQGLWRTARQRLVELAKNDVSQTWNQPQNYDLYLPFLSWHNRFMYDKEKTDNYNEMPWGGGFGVSRYNEEGNWSSLYAMMFKDSHNEWQPIIGYGWEKGWYLDSRRIFAWAWRDRRDHRPR
jgi:palmitoyl transferase